MKNLNAIAAMLDRVIHDTQEEQNARMDWLREYLKRGGGASHVAAGEALAAAVLTAAVLNGTPKVIRDLLCNPQAGQVGREDFRFDFARCSLLLVLENYVADRLSCTNSQLNRKTGISLLYELIQALAYEAGQLAEDIGFPPAML